MIKKHLPSISGNKFSLPVDVNISGVTNTVTSVLTQSKS